MACTACGEKEKTFPPSVIEIVNPDKLVLFRKVVIPASLGDDTTIPPAVGKYANVLLNYEANAHSYLYSSDGIPTLLSGDIPQNLEARVATLETKVASLETEMPIVFTPQEWEAYWNN